MQSKLFCALIDLLDEGTDVVAPDDLVYSTKPKKAVGMDNHNYYIKGPDRNIIVAEAVAHQLAKDLNLTVPEFGIAARKNDVGPFFASREVDRCQRQVEQWIRRDRTVNRQELAAVAAFDIWVMNKDRNLGNLVGCEQIGPNDGRIALVAIDFEKAMALRGPYPLTTTPEIAPRALWPSGTLGQLLSGEGQPIAFFAQITAVTRERVLDAVNRVEALLNEEISWKESSAQLLSNRAKHIRVLAEEVWR